VTGAGYLSTTATWLPGTNWGTITVGDSNILPETTYHVQAVYSGIGPTYPVTVTTGKLGDVTSPFGAVDFRDVHEMISAFLGNENALPIEWCDLLPAVPDGLVDFKDISRAVDSFRGALSTLPSPCP